MSTIEIALDKGTVLIDSEDIDRLGGRSVYIGNNGYAYFSTNATGPITLHSFVMGGSRPGLHIDHINGNKLDDRKDNLRFISPSLNQVNRKALNRNNTSGVRGVAKTNSSIRNPWRAQITVSGVNHYLGLFATEQEAVEARRAAEIDLFGEATPWASRAS